jgi:hypothetical protein
MKHKIETSIVLLFAMYLGAGLLLFVLTGCGAQMDRTALDEVKATHCKALLLAEARAEASGVIINAHDKAVIEVCRVAE